MKLTGLFEIKLDKNLVWKALNDPEILKKSIPGCEEFKKNSDTNFTVTATNKIGPFNATLQEILNLKISILLIVIKLLVKEILQLGLPQEKLL